MNEKVHKGHEQGNFPLLFYHAGNRQGRVEKSSRESTRPHTSNKDTHNREESSRIREQTTFDDNTVCDKDHTGELKEQYIEDTKVPIHQLTTALQ